MSLISRRTLGVSIATFVIASVPLSAFAQDAAPDPIVITATDSAPVAETQQQPEAPPAIEPTPLNPFRIVGRRRRVPGRYAAIPMFQLVPPLAHVRVRAGVSFPSLGAAIGPGGGAIGTGLGLQLGAQIDRVGVYYAGRVETFLGAGYFESNAIVDYALNDRVQLGTGIGVFAVFGGNRVFDPAVVFPVHVGVTAMQWRTQYGGRSGLHFDLDVEPGIGLGTYVGSAFALHLGLGWAWL